MARLILLLGPAASGKSAHAVSLGRRDPGPCAFLATARALDDEMAEKIRRHRAERPPDWTTVEEPEDLAGALDRLGGEGVRFCVVGSVTVWIGQLLAAGEEGARVEGRLAALLDSVAHFEGTVVCVSDEVGAGVVPDNPLARAFRDVAGRCHRKIAAAADRVLWFVAGIPHLIKGGGES